MAMPPDHSQAGLTVGNPFCAAGSRAAPVLISYLLRVDDALWKIGQP